MTRKGFRPTACFVSFKKIISKFPTDLFLKKTNCSHSKASRLIFCEKLRKKCNLLIGLSQSYLSNTASMKMVFLKIAICIMNAARESWWQETNVTCSNTQCDHGNPTWEPLSQLFLTFLPTSIMWLGLTAAIQNEFAYPAE